jgi:hypothetical protein
MIRAARIGGHAHRYLLAARGDTDRAAGRPLTGHVIATFRHGLNIVFDEATARAWVSVQTPAVPFHPWAIEVPAIPPGVQVGLAVSSGDACIALGAGDLSIRDASIDELRIAPYSAEQAECALSRLPLFEQLLEEEAARRSADPFQPQMNAILERWRATDDPRVLADLVGLGVGSTPSGDDLIVGLAAGLTALCNASDKAGRSLQALRSGLRGEGCRTLARTAPASRQAVAAALEASFPEPLCLLIGDLGTHVADGEQIRRSVWHVQALGATSGASMLRGLRAAWH